MNFRSLFLLSFLCLACTDCATTKLKAPTINIEVCEDQSVMKQSAKLVTTSGVILLAGQDNWEKQLEGLRKEFGSPALVCAVQEAVDRFRKIAVLSEDGTDYIGAVYRGMTYLAAHSK